MVMVIFWGFCVGIGLDRPGGGFTMARCGFGRRLLFRRWIRGRGGRWLCAGGRHRLDAL